MASPQEDPQAGPSEDIPEGIVIIGDDSSMHVIALKTFQLDKTWTWRTVILMTLTLTNRPRLLCVCILNFNKKKFKK